MTVSDLKLKIFRQIDSLEKSRLEELYGVFINYMNGKKEISDWEKLTKEQKQGIVDAIEEIDSGNSFPNEKVITDVLRIFDNRQYPNKLRFK